MNAIRRSLVALAAIIAAVPVVHGASSHTEVIRRLVGAWRSDRERTLAEWVHLSTATPEARAKIESWFGDFTYTFTSTRVKAEYPGGSWEAPYRVRMVHGEQVTLELRHPDKFERLVIRFTGPYFSIPIGNGTNAEYFRKVAA